MNQAAERLETQDEDQVFRLHSTHGFNPIDFPICTQIPKRLGVPTAWIGHVPFAMGLVAMARPRVLVELGTQWGVSYCAFCQAVKAMRLDTRCYAVDTWHGDPHSGFFGSEVLADLTKHNDAEYSALLRAHPIDLRRGPAALRDGSIDVLHIDGFHSYEAVKHDYETWLPKMSDRGVILFHDTEIRGARPSASGGSGTGSSRIIPISSSTIRSAWASSPSERPYPPGFGRSSIHPRRRRTGSASTSRTWVST